MRTVKLSERTLSKIAYLILIIVVFFAFFRTEQVAHKAAILAKDNHVLTLKNQQQAADNERQVQQTDAKLCSISAQRWVVSHDTIVTFSEPVSIPDSSRMDPAAVERITARNVQLQSEADRLLKELGPKPIC